MWRLWSGSQDRPLVKAIDHNFMSTSDMSMLPCDCGGHVFTTAVCKLGNAEEETDTKKRHLGSSSI